MPTPGMIRGPLLLFLCFWAMTASPLSAGQIVGVTFTSGFYSVNPLTGDTTELLAGCAPDECGPYFGSSRSPDPGTIYDASVVNIHQVNVTTFQSTPIGGIFYAEDLAFDPVANMLYGTSGSALFRVQCPSPAAACTETQIGPGFGVSNMQALDFVPGVALYGASDNNLYVIDTSTGMTTLVGFTGITSEPLGNTNITDLAWDPDTGRLIASVGCVKQMGPGPLGSGGPCDGSISGSIYWLDLSDGHATLLNGNAPHPAVHGACGGCPGTGNLPDGCGGAWCPAGLATAALSSRMSERRRRRGRSEGWNALERWRHAPPRIVSYFDEHRTGHPPQPPKTGQKQFEAVQSPCSDHLPANPHLPSV